jgi:tRNA U34 5-methylaminomethyl-2-thiouridine-forming methyltransferase MnmC
MSDKQSAMSDRLPVHHSSLTTNHYFDLVYFDAFAPEKQPEMWSEELFRHIYAAMNNNGILTTYCAKGVIRRLLQAIGFRVERLPGPPGGKREILRASKTKE